MPNNTLNAEPSDDRTVMSPTTDLWLRTADFGAAEFLALPNEVDEIANGLLVDCALCLSEPYVGFDPEVPEPAERVYGVLGRRSADDWDGP